MKMVKVVYTGEQALEKVDKNDKKKRVTNNRVLSLSTGKLLKLVAGKVHEMPEVDYKKFCDSPVGKELMKRKVLYLRDDEAKVKAELAKEKEDKHKKIKAEAKAKAEEAKEAAEKAEESKKKKGKK